MAHPVYVHIGPPRTGTTAVQQLLWRNRHELLAQGISYPGRANRTLHFAAATELVYGDDVPPGETPRPGAWAELTREILAHDGPSVISHERFASAEEPAVARLLVDLAERDVHVIYTIRDMLAITLSAYLGFLKRGSTLTLDEHVARATAGKPQQRVWRTAAGWSLRRWGAAVPPDRMHVVTVPPKTAPRTELWERFSSVIGHAPGRGTVKTMRTNESVGVVEADFLHRLNILGGDGWTTDHQQFVRHVLTPQLLSRREGQRKLQLSNQEARAVLARQTHVLAAEIATCGFHVVGDLSDLEVEVGPPELDPDHDEVTEEEFAELAMSCTRQLVQLAQAAQANEPANEQASADLAGAREGRTPGFVSALRRAERWSPPHVRRLARRIARRS